MAAVPRPSRRTRSDRRGFALVSRLYEADRAVAGCGPFVGGSRGRIGATLARCGFGAAVAVVAAAVTIYLDSVPDVWRHVVTWNALSWSVDQACPSRSSALS